MRHTDTPLPLTTLLKRIQATTPEISRPLRWSVGPDDLAKRSSAISCGATQAIQAQGHMHKIGLFLLRGIGFTPLTPKVQRVNGFGQKREAPAKLPTSRSIQSSVWRELSSPHPRHSPFRPILFRLAVVETKGTILGGMGEFTTHFRLPILAVGLGCSLGVPWRSIARAPQAGTDRVELRRLAGRAEKTRR